MSSAGLSAARTRRIVPTRSARPSSAKYSQCSGISTASAATSAFSVSRPSDGGQSMKMWSYSSRSGARSARSRSSRWGSGDQLDFGAGEVAIGGDEAEAIDAGRDDERARVGERLGGRERVVDRAAGRGLALLSDAAREVALRIDVDEEDALVRRAASDAARLMVVVVLPTPPFWLATATMRLNLVI